MNGLTAQEEFERRSAEAREAGRRIHATLAEIPSLERATLVEGGLLVAGRLVAEYLACRSALAEATAQHDAAQPAVVDHHGRQWTYSSRFSSDHDPWYTHCGMGYPEEWILDGTSGLPSRHALQVRRYAMCDICLDGRERSAQ